MSPRNTPAAVAQLLRKTSCHRLITTQTTLRSLIDGLRAELAADDFDLVIEEIPSLAEIYPKLGRELADDPFEPYPEHPSRPGLSDLALYLHSSGSTGFPKAIPQTHIMMVHWAAFRASNLFPLRIIAHDILQQILLISGTINLACALLG